MFGGTGITFDSHMPKNSAGTATTKPAIGPAMPMSNSAFFHRMG